jgi:hypothetical protein
MTNSSTFTSWRKPLFSPTKAQTESAPKMTNYICTTCGTQYGGAIEAPEHCAVCDDERQYVGWEGQQWTTHELLRSQYRQHTVSASKKMTVRALPRRDGWLGPPYFGITIKGN